jgi:hypothetical protein
MINWAKIFSSKPLALAIESLEAAHEQEAYNALHTDYLLRDRAWKIYEAYLTDHRQRSISEWTDGICSVQNFYQKILKNTQRLLWVLTPVVDHNVYNNALRAKALDRAFEILDLSPENEDGSLNTTLLASQVKLIESIVTTNVY